jgi:Na+-translocating ferredoxin:NAD+ oxidoreductase RnfA subunit
MPWPCALGFGLAITLFAGIREQLDLNNIPKAFRGVPISLIVALELWQWHLWDFQE